MAHLQQQRQQPLSGAEAALTVAQGLALLAPAAAHPEQLRSLLLTCLSNLASTPGGGVGSRHGSAAEDGCEREALLWSSCVARVLASALPAPALAGELLSAVAMEARLFPGLAMALLGSLFQRAAAAEAAAAAAAAAVEAMCGAGGDAAAAPAGDEEYGGAGPGGRGEAAADLLLLYSLHMAGGLRLEMECAFALRKLVDAASAGGASPASLGAAAAAADACVPGVADFLQEAALNWLATTAVDTECFNATGATLLRALLATPDLPAARAAGVAAALTDAVAREACADGPLWTALDELVAAVVVAGGGGGGGGGGGDTSASASGRPPLLRLPPAAAAAAAARLCGPSTLIYLSQELPLGAACRAVACLAPLASISAPFAASLLRTAELFAEEAGGGGGGTQGALCGGGCGADLLAALSLLSLLRWGGGGGAGPPGLAEALAAAVAEPPPPHAVPLLAHVARAPPASLPLAAPSPPPQQQMQQQPQRRSGRRGGGAPPPPPPPLPPLLLAAPLHPPQPPTPAMQLQLALHEALVARAGSAGDGPLAPFLGALRLEPGGAISEAWPLPAALRAQLALFSAASDLPGPSTTPNLAPLHPALGGGAAALAPAAALLHAAAHAATAVAAVSAADAADPLLRAASAEALACVQALLERAALSPRMGALLALAAAAEAPRLCASACAPVASFAATASGASTSARGRAPAARRASAAASRMAAAAAEAAPSPCALCAALRHVSARVTELQSRGGGGSGGTVTAAAAAGGLLLPLQLALLGAHRALAAAAGGVRPRTARAGGAPTAEGADGVQVKQEPGGSGEAEGEAEWLASLAMTEDAGPMAPGGPAAAPGASRQGTFNMVADPRALLALHAQLLAAAAASSSTSAPATAGTAPSLDADAAAALAYLQRGMAGCVAAAAAARPSRLQRQLAGVMPDAGAPWRSDAVLAAVAAAAAKAHALARAADSDATPGPASPLPPGRGRRAGELAGLLRATAAMRLPDPANAGPAGDLAASSLHVVGAIIGALQRRRAAPPRGLEPPALAAALAPPAALAAAPCAALKALDPSAGSSAWYAAKRVAEHCPGRTLQLHWALRLGQLAAGSGGTAAGVVAAGISSPLAIASVAEVDAAARGEAAALIALINALASGGGGTSEEAAYAAACASQPSMPRALLSGLLIRLLLGDGPGGERAGGGGGGGLPPALLDAAAAGGLARLACAFAPGRAGGAQLAADALWHMADAAADASADAVRPVGAAHFGFPVHNARRSGLLCAGWRARAAAASSLLMVLQGHLRDAQARRSAARIGAAAARHEPPDAAEARAAAAAVAGVDMLLALPATAGLLAAGPLARAAWLALTAALQASTLAAVTLLQRASAGAVPASANAPFSPRPAWPTPDSAPPTSTPRRLPPPQPLQQQGGRFAAALSTSRPGGSGAPALPAPRRLQPTLVFSASPARDTPARAGPSSVAAAAVAAAVAASPARTPAAPLPVDVPQLIHLCACAALGPHAAATARRWCESLGKRADERAGVLTELAQGSEQAWARLQVALSPVSSAAAAPLAALLATAVAQAAPAPPGASADGPAGGSDATAAAGEPIPQEPLELLGLLTDGSGSEGEGGPRGTAIDGPARGGKAAPKRAPKRKRGAPARPPVSANAYVRACLAEEGRGGGRRRRKRSAAADAPAGSGSGSDSDGGGSSGGGGYSDLDDFIVCQPERDYGALVAARFRRARGVEERRAL